MRGGARGRAGWAIGLAAGLLLVAFCLRVYRLDAQSVWFDEGWSWYLAGLPLGQMAQVTAADRSPFVYYALLHGWTGLAGDSEFALRYLSVCADVVAVALVVALGRALSRDGRQAWLAWPFGIPASMSVSAALRVTDDKPAQVSGGVQGSTVWTSSPPG